jgi:hypothetical protein
MAQGTRWSGSIHCALILFGPVVAVKRYVCDLLQVVVNKGEIILKEYSIQSCFREQEVYDWCW